MADLRKLLDEATPGPWRVGPVDDTVVVAADGSEIAAIDGDYNEPDLWPMMEANARLIALAPDLAAALIKAEEALRPFAEIGISENPEYQPMIRMDRDAIIAARAALSEIKKLRGE